MEALTAAEALDPSADQFYTRSQAQIRQSQAAILTKIRSQNNIDISRISTLLA